MMKRTLTILILTIFLVTAPLTAFSYKHLESAPLANGVFLVSTPELKDSPFNQTVILIISCGAWITVKADTKKVFSDNPLSIWPFYFSGPEEQLIQRGNDTGYPVAMSLHN